MTPTIRIDDEVFAELQKLAEPFVDTPNRVLRRLLNLSDAITTEAKTGYGADRVPVSAYATPRRELNITSQADYRAPILKALGAMGGRGDLEGVLDRVFREMEPRLKPMDHEPVKSGSEARWRNLARWERKAMVREGYLSTSSPRGIWELTEVGWQEYRRLNGEA